MARSPSAPDAAVTGGSSRVQNRRGSGGKLRNEIIEAALRVLADTPAAAVSMRAIAREANVSHAAIYLQYDTIDHVILDVCRRTWSDLAAAMARADERASGEGALARLKAQIRAYLRFAFTSQTQYQALFALSPDLSEVIAQGEQAPSRPAFEVLESSVKRCRVDGLHLISDSDIDMTVLVFAIAHGRVAMSHASAGTAKATKAEVGRFVERMLDQIITE